VDPLFGLLPWATPGQGSFLHSFSLPILAIILGISMWMQQKLNPAPADPAQKMIFAWMPWIFMFMLGGFASGLVLYWITNNTITIMQQYTIMSMHGHRPDLFGNIRLMAINARLDEAAARLTLIHPDLPEISFRPDDADGSGAVSGLGAPDLCPPTGRSLRDLFDPGAGHDGYGLPFRLASVAASNRALSDQMGVPLSPLRWRGNFWIDGLDPFAECDLIGRTVRLGAARLELWNRSCVAWPRRRTPQPANGMRIRWAHCRATTANQNFGVYARVIDGGTVRQGDRLEVLA
jgi:hypothetical protein